MASIKFYLDRPFNTQLSADEIQKITSQYRQSSKHYPKHILNPLPTALYMFFSPHKGSRIKINTFDKVLPERWDFYKGKYKSGSLGATELNLRLDQTTVDIQTDFETFKKEHPVFDEAEVKKFVEGYFSQIKDDIKSSLRIAKDDFLFKKEGVLTNGTLKEYRTIFKALIAYEEEKKVRLEFNSFNQVFFDDFEKFLLKKKNPKKKEGRGLVNDTIAKYTATLKTFLQWCYENGYHKNVAAFTKIKTRIKKRSKNEIVALTEDELMQLYQFDLNGDERLERVRDLFCFGCFTGQRFSDIMRFDKADFKGHKWEFMSLKNKKMVNVPMAGFIANALPILKKYDYQLPTLSNQKFNDYLKEVGEKAEIDAQVRIVRFSGVKEIETIQSKFKYMSSHMARRTFVTIMLEKGVPITMVQKITQHSDLRTLIKYEGHSEGALFNSFKNT